MASVEAAASDTRINLPNNIISLTVSLIALNVTVRFVIWRQSIFSTSDCFIPSHWVDSVGFSTVVKGLERLLSSLPTGCSSESLWRTHDKFLQTTSVFGFLARVVTILPLYSPASAVRLPYSWLLLALAVWGTFWNTGITELKAIFVDSFAIGQSPMFSTQRSVLINLANTPLSSLTLLCLLILLIICIVRFFRTGFSKTMSSFSNSQATAKEHANEKTPLECVATMAQGAPFLSQHQRSSCSWWNVRVLLLFLSTVFWTKCQAMAIECEIYIAESTIPGAGTGIFTGVAKSKGDTIGNGDKAIPLIDFYWHVGGDFFNPMSDYLWHGIGMGMDQETEGKTEMDITAFWPGLDAMVNCNLGLLNVIKSTPVYDEAGLHRNLHPGAGAITPYGGVPTKVIRDIPAGGELFKHYGDHWFISRGHVFGDGFPVSENYDEIVPLMGSLKNKMDEKSVSKELQSSIYTELIQEIKRIWDSRTLNALHNFSWEEIEQAIEAKDMGILLQPNATRPLEWLNEYGKCIDHIVPGLSTIDGAGHGAFAKRDLPKGTIITGSPLVHFPFREVFRMYDWAPGSSERLGVVGDQLLLNYCFSHPETTVVLCPYGSGQNFINHNQSQANVKVQWCQDGLINHHSEWLKARPEALEWEFRTKLAIDYVALRDIEAGEELFLDYGEDWEKAWQEHVLAWGGATSNGDEYLSATQYNTLYEEAPVRTREEQLSEPYPANLAIHCHSSFEPATFKEMNEYVDEPLDHPIEYINELGWTPEDKGLECVILERDSDLNLYRVAIQFLEDGEYYEQLVNDVPRIGIRFMDVPYTTDIHLRRVFRHPIGLPDEMIPDAWRNSVDTNDL